MSRPSPSTRSLALLLAASTLAGALQTPSALLAHVQAACTPSGPPVCIIDGNNLRGAEYFGSSQGSLRGLVEGWADEAQLPAVLILDHGPAERAWHVSGHAVLTLSGEGRTADDVIVRDAWYLRHELGRNVFVVTNDQGLIGRVKRYRSPAGSVQVLHTRAFARLLGIEESSATDANSRPRETTADRSAAALELAAQLEAGAGGPTEKGPSDADALLAQYVTWVNTEAPRPTRPFLDHTLSGVPPSPSLKRRLRRKRFKPGVVGA